ncbi:hypothetical protein VTN96DRAFT_534 [Rasamsonia emersonii]
MDPNVFSNHFVYEPSTVAHSSSVPSPAATYGSRGRKLPPSVHLMWSGVQLPTSELPSNMSPTSPSFSTLASPNPFVQLANNPASYGLGNHPHQVDAPGGAHFPGPYNPTRSLSLNSPVYSRDVAPSFNLRLNVDPTGPPAGLAAASPNPHHLTINYSRHIQFRYTVRPVAASTGQGHSEMVLQMPHAHVADSGALLPQQTQGQIQSASPSLTISDTDQFTRLEAPDIKIVFENPKNPSPRPYKKRKTNEEAKKQKEDNRLLKECGGACVWCYKNKKGCDSEQICAQCTANGRVCFRGYSQLWLFIPVLEKPENLQKVSKDRTFQRAYEVLSHLKNTWSQQPFVTQIVADFRRGVHGSPNLLAANISELKWPVDGTKGNSLKERWITRLLADIKVPELNYLVIDPAESRIVKNAVEMLKLFATIVTLLGSRVYVSPANMGVAQTTVFFVLTLLAITLGETSADFCLDLWKRIRGEELRRQNTSTEDAAETRRVNPLWLAIGIYHEVIVGLISNLESGGLVSKIFDFDNIGSHLDAIRSRIRYLLTRVPPSQGSGSELLNESKVDNCLSSIVPKLPVLEGGYDIALWASYSKTQGPTSTTASRQEMAYDQPQYEMGDLFNEQFDIDMIRKASAGQVPCPPASYSRCLPAVGRQAVTDQDVSWSPLDERQVLMGNDGATSDRQTTEDDALFDYWTDYDQYSVTSRLTSTQTDSLSPGPQIGNKPHQQGGAETLDATDHASDTAYASTHHDPLVDDKPLDLDSFSSFVFA